MCTTLGPVEARIKWLEDEEPYEIGDAEDPIDAQRYVETCGVLGCVVETRKPVCGCCGVSSWEHAASLWSIVGDADFHRVVESELLDEAAHA